MKNTILFSILERLTESELEAWLRFVASDYHCSNSKVHSLSQLIANYQPRWDHPKLEKQAAWKQLFPGKTYREASMNNYVSDLLQLTYQFLAHQQLQQQSDLQYELQIQQLLDRNLTKPAERLYKKWLKLSSDAKGAEALRIRQVQARYQDTFGLLASRRKHINALQDQSSYLDQYYALQQLINYCGMLSRQSIVQGHYELSYLEEILRRYRNNEQGLQEVPAIGIYVALVRLLHEDSSEEDFRALQERLHRDADTLPESEQKTVYNFLLNYCIRQINRGQPHYYQAVFSIYQDLLSTGLLLQDGRLTQWTYTNIITAASRLKAWDWTEAFINDYRDLLPAKDRYNAFHYNISALRYERGQYDEALQGLHQVEFTDAFYQLAAKTIQLKIYYRQEEVEAFQALVFASKQFVMRNRQLSAAKKQAYQNFLKLIRRLFDLRTQQPYWNTAKWEQRYAQLQERLTNQNYSANNKDWLKGELQLLVSSVS